MEWHDQCFSSILSYSKFGDFFKKLTKLAEFTPEIYSKKLSILSFDMTKIVEKNNSGHDLI
jgi:hypothetical protein